MELSKMRWEFVKKYVGLLWFDEVSLLRASDSAFLVGGVVFVLLAILLQAISLLSLDFASFQFTFLISAARFFGALFVLYILIKVLSSESHFDFVRFLYGVSLACVSGLLLSWLLFGVGLLFELGSVSLVKEVVSIVKPYYLMLLFGFSAESLSGLRGWKGIVVALMGISALFVLSLWL